MVKHFFIIILLVLLEQSAYVQAQTDTLRHFEPANVNNHYIDVPDYGIQVARFDNLAPGNILGFRVYTLGDSGSAATLNVYGHEAGVVFPQLRINLIKPINIRKSKNGFEIIDVNLAQPITIRANQFFVGLTAKQSNFHWLIDQNQQIPYCKSADGGDYYYGFINVTRNIPVDQWRLSSGYYAVEAVMDYPLKQSPTWLRNETAAIGLDENMSNTSSAWADVNKDGYLDLLSAGRLFFNNKDGYFTEVTQSLGLSGSPRANAIVDLDNDGDEDLLYLGIAGGKSKAYFQQTDGNFSETMLNEIPDLKGLSGFSMADINEDGYLDLFLTQLWDTYPNPLPNFLFVNDSKGRFVRADERLFNPSADRRSRGCVFSDFDQDGDADLFVTNYFLEPDELWINEKGEFYNRASNYRIDRNNTGSSHGTGCDFGDFDADGDLDLLVTQLAHPRFVNQYDHRGTTVYINSGAPNFRLTDAKKPSEQNVIGIEYEETHAGGSWGDVNNDGLADLAISTYYGCRYVDLHIQKTDHTYEEQSWEYGLFELVTGEDVCWADYNGDGKLDLTIGEGYRFRLYRNYVDNQNHYVHLKLVPKSGNKSAIGSQAVVYAGNLKILQEVQLGKGQRMQRPTTLHYGLGQNTSIDSVVVFWNAPKRGKEVFFPKDVDKIIILEEGKGIKLNRSIEIVNALGAIVYPNPVEGHTLNFSLENEKPQPIDIILLNQQGQIVFQTNIKPLNNTISLELPAYIAKGLYFFRLTQNEQIVYGKWIKQ